MIEELIRFRCLVMMIGMPAQLKKQQPANDVVAVPTVFGKHIFIASFVHFFPNQSIMLDVIDSF